MTTIEYPPGGSSPPHRHDAQVFVYVLQGRVVMQVRGGPRMTLGPGQMFYENPSDIHVVSANASKTEPAKFLAFVIKDKDKPGTLPAAPAQAQASGADGQVQAPPAPAAASPGLMSRDVIGLPGKEVVVAAIPSPPGQISPPHRHNAQVFVYILQGTMIMQVKGGPRMTLGAGQVFYESPSDIHTVSANASKTEPAKFLAILIKDKGKPAVFPAVAKH